MEFKDYYKILEVDQSSTLSEIKSAFKKQAIKWHPDRNPNIDTTAKMQEINEAYLILKDIEARERYDREYLKYKKFKSSRQKQQHNKTKKQSRTYSNTEKKQTQEREYEFDDEILKNWIRNAKRQAVDLAKQTIKEIGELSITATKAAGSKMLELFVAYFIVGIIFLLIFKACTN